jgi:hypothetical protein
MFKNIVLVILGVALILAVSMSGIHKGEVVAYPCSMAEISPDIPIEVKQKCRQLQKQPVMKDGCVYQESHGQVIKTCG